MIYEFRTYTLKPRSLAEVEKRYGEAYEYRKKYSPLTAFWHTEIGPLNEIIHVWGYKDLAERARIRAEASKDANWPPKIRDFVVDQDVEILTPLSFVPGVEFGAANRFVHIWAYKSMDQRLAVREQGRKAGIWPPPGGGDELIAQSSKIVMPSAFSPLQ